MVRLGRLSVAVVAAALLAAAVAAPALAIYPQQSITVSGPAINGVVPRGEAKVDQSKLPKEPGRLEVRVKNVNLPDGTVLTVNYGGIEPGAGANVGSFTLRGREGSPTTTLPFSAGANDDIAVMNGSTIVLSQSDRWKT